MSLVSYGLGGLQATLASYGLGGGAARVICIARSARVVIQTRLLAAPAAVLTGALAGVHARIPRSPAAVAAAGGAHSARARREVQERISERANDRHRGAHRTGEAKVIRLAAAEPNIASQQTERNYGARRIRTIVAIRRPCGED
ncbi:MAG: hypothetical protein Tsb0010_18160 [Parvularculaceae bacterium]